MMFQLIEFRDKWGERAISKTQGPEKISTHRKGIGRGLVFRSRVHLGTATAPPPPPPTADAAATKWKLRIIILSSFVGRFPNTSRSHFPTFSPFHHHPPGRPGWIKMRDDTRHDVFSPSSYWGPASATRPRTSAECELAASVEDLQPFFFFSVLSYSRVRVRDDIDLICGMSRERPRTTFLSRFSPARVTRKIRSTSGSFENSQPSLG